MNERAKLLICEDDRVARELLEEILRGENHEVTILSRHAGEAAVMWDAHTVGAWASRLEGADAIVNLVGEGIVGKRWTTKQKEILRSSRLDSTRALVSAISQTSSRPKILINASAVGFYGNVPEGDVTEDSPKGKGFLADLCAEWEAEAKKAQALGVRTVLLRLGVILEKDGGALQKFLPPFRFFVGGPLGSGRRYFPWVHREDVVGAILYALKDPSFSGTFNMTAPGVLTMKEFCSVLGKVMGRPSWAPVPSFVLKALLGEMSEMLLTGQKVVSNRLQDKGFRFRYPSAEKALSAILQK